jgi:hypothetical protein
MTEPTTPTVGEKVSWRDPEALVSGMVFLLFGGGYLAAYIVTPPADSAQAIGQLQGASIGALASVVSYWLGSSRGSRRNADRADRAVAVASKAVEEGK